MTPADILGWCFMVIVCTVAGLWLGMFSFMVNMDRGGMHPVLGSISGAFFLFDAYLLFHPPFHIFHL